MDNIGLTGPQRRQIEELMRQAIADGKDKPSAQAWVQGQVGDWNQTYFNLTWTRLNKKVAA